ncbi:hypothetical protein BDY24DRAFT_2528 [Mrakia frigida]|uniref:uncharacterized protein n=1 Tax=Mrakia frigida TaxID=29902 RepID=UPI003FCC08A6
MNESSHDSSLSTVLSFQVAFFTRCTSPMGMGLATTLRASDFDFLRCRLSNFYMYDGDPCRFEKLCSLLSHIRAQRPLSLDAQRFLRTVFIGHHTPSLPPTGLVVRSPLPVLIEFGFEFAASAGRSELRSFLSIGTHRLPPFLLWLSFLVPLFLSLVSILHMYAPE